MTVDYTKMSDGDMVHACGQDAGKWAAAFIQKNPGMDHMEDAMLGWFANAIMHSLDVERGTIINGEHAEYLLSRAV